jgi:hypothetical protein
LHLSILKSSDRFYNFFCKVFIKFFGVIWDCMKDSLEPHCIYIYLVVYLWVAVFSSWICDSSWDILHINMKSVSFIKLVYVARIGEKCNDCLLISFIKNVC